MKLDIFDFMNVYCAYAIYKLFLATIETPLTTNV